MRLTLIADLGRQAPEGVSAAPKNDRVAVAGLRSKAL